jgi:aminoglycoside/choline kinase family phosphotransferase
MKASPEDLTASIPWMEDGVRRWVQGPVEIVAIEARPLGEVKTHAISRFQLTLRTGQRLDVIFKRLRRQPGKDVGREVLAYRRLLADGQLGAPRLYASACDDRRGRYWLLLEDVGNRRLDDCGTDERVEAVRWAARMHAAYHDRQDALRGLRCLGEHGPAFYTSLVTAARARLVAAWETGALRRFDRLMARFPETVEVLDQQPRTLVHGGLSDHNILVQGDGPVRIRPIDWEWAAIGAGAWDLAKLLAGGTSAAELRAVYLDELRRAGAAAGPCALDAAAFDVALRQCAILRALWGLGCPPPPPPGVSWDHAGLDRILDEIAAFQEAGAAGP